jgi:hypothetical protein
MSTAQDLELKDYESMLGEWRAGQRLGHFLLKDQPLDRPIFHAPLELDEWDFLELAGSSNG